MRMMIMGMIIQCPPSYSQLTVRGVWIWKEESPPNLNSDKSDGELVCMHWKCSDLNENLCHISEYCINDIHLGLRLAMMLFTSMTFFFFNL